LFDTGNNCILGFVRYQPKAESVRVLVLANLADSDEIIDVDIIREAGFSIDEM